MKSVIVAPSFVVSESLTQHPLYNDWSNKTFTQIVAAKSDLQAAIKGTIPTPDNVEIIAYLYNLLVISNQLS